MPQQHLKQLLEARTVVQHKVFVGFSHEAGHFFGAHHTPLAGAFFKAVVHRGLYRQGMQLHMVKPADSGSTFFYAPKIQHMPHAQ